MRINGATPLSASSSSRNSSTCQSKSRWSERTFSFGDRAFNAVAQFLTDYRHQRCASHATTPEFHSNSFNAITYARIALATCYTALCATGGHSRARSRKSRTYIRAKRAGCTHRRLLVYPGAAKRGRQANQTMTLVRAVKTREPRNENPELCTGAGQVRKWILARIRMSRNAPRSPT